MMKRPEEHWTESICEGRNRKAGQQEILVTDDTSGK